MKSRKIRAKLVFFLLSGLLMAACTTQPTPEQSTPAALTDQTSTTPAPTLQPTATTARLPTLEPASTAPTREPRATPQQRDNVHDAEDHTTDLTIQRPDDIASYPGAQPVPPDKNPLIASVVESLTQQTVPTATVEVAVSMLVGGEAGAIPRDVELFYTTELTEWQSAPQANLDVALAEEPGATLTSQMSWQRGNSIFTVLLLDQYGQQVLITILRTHTP